MSGNTRRALQGRILYKTIDLMLGVLAPRATQRPIIDVVIDQKRPIRTRVKQFPSGDWEIRMTFRDDAIAGLPEKINEFTPTLLPEVRKLAKFLVRFTL